MYLDHEYLFKDIYFSEVKLKKCMRVENYSQRQIASRH
jgi:hypothetical protein